MGFIIYLNYMQLNMLVSRGFHLKKNKFRKSRESVRTVRNGFKTVKNIVELLLQYKTNLTKVYKFRSDGKIFISVTIPIFFSILKTVSQK